MSQEKLFIPILLGTTRDGRKSEYVARLLYTALEQHPEINTKFFDVREMSFPLDNEGEGIKKMNPEYRDAVIRADGLVIVTPEYNRGYPGSLKMALDMLLKEYIHKAVGLAGVSSGGFGGARVVQSLLSVMRELGLVATFTDLNVSRVGDVFDENGTLKDEAIHGRINAFLEELVWMSKTLRWGRENIPSKYHSQ